MCEQATEIHKSKGSGHISRRNIETPSKIFLINCLCAIQQPLSGHDVKKFGFELLEIPKLRMEACIQVARSVAEAYELIYDTIMDPNNRYSDPTTCKASFKPDKNDFGNITIEI
ncbi:conserved oligomeric Golgi complex subunit 6 [Cucumis melo var. makuwa]|uniref:Conserved oligomeric Golgi complex subunit 6 n=1 Tax=Cucumis melo var. makuwa TaxID=1194695 RepID=A0A5A7UFH5_CUCMM|nr:conserved oligomeric Golgi complex subunit 6 [Cucumis melo var. makuwa]TYK01793.1 conserved oligomeric Golgi complex subunit 6 [Cucumis melo var. makuwa]